jgi:hypothetical protein
MATQKNFIKGGWANNRVNQFQEDEINISFTDEFIEHLKSLPKNEKEFRNITIARQKDRTKWSVFENTFIPRSNAGPNSESSSEDLPDWLK